MKKNQRKKSKSKARIICQNKSEKKSYVCMNFQRQDMQEKMKKK